MNFVSPKSLLREPADNVIPMRNNLVAKDGSVLCVNFDVTNQKIDIHRELIKDVKNDKFMYRAKINCKSFDNEMRKSKNLAPFDFSNEEIKKELKNDDNFDIPLWFLRKAGDKLENIVKYDCPFIYQIKGCVFCSPDDVTSGCLYCFVDNASNDGKPEGGEFIGVDNIVQTFKRYREEKGLVTIRTSGGEPTLVLDHILSLYKELQANNIPIFHQFDTNLSSTIRILIDKEIYPRDILNQLAEYDPKVLAAFKGTSSLNIMENTQTITSLFDQINSFIALVDAGIDVYPYIYNPDPRYMELFLMRLEEKVKNAALRLHIGKLKIYTPTKIRIEAIAKENGLNPQRSLEELEKYFSECYEKSREILNVFLKEKHGVEYREVERPSVKLKKK